MAKATDMISIRVTPDMKKWMKNKGKGPTEIFDQGLKELKCPDMPIRRKRR